MANIDKEICVGGYPYIIENIPDQYKHLEQEFEPQMGTGIQLSPPHASRNPDIVKKLNCN